MSQIKNRLKAAYENVEFHASDTWVNGSDAFQKANQELYVREGKVKDTLSDDPNRPRTVRDSIPQSRLAQFSNYEYSEARELCYASSATNISFYYPCICKRSSIKEPWMIPEVEQLFIWFSYAPDFNILELIRLEELGHLEEQEHFKGDSNLDTRWHDFHEISPVYYETFERTPGKSRYRGCSPVSATDLVKFMPCQLKIETFEDMILRMKIKSDNVKYLWSDHSRHISETTTNEPKVNVLKSPLGNYFLLENAEETERQPKIKELNKNTDTDDDRHCQSTDFGYIRNLTESLLTLEALIINSTTATTAVNDYKAPTAVPKSESPPTRRLYSAVLQGLAADKKQANTSAVISQTNTIIKEQSSLSKIAPVKTIPSNFTARNSTIISTPTYKPTSAQNHTSIHLPSQWLTQSSHWGAPISSNKISAEISYDEIKCTPTQTNIITLKSSPCVETNVSVITAKLPDIPSKPTNTTLIDSSTCSVNAFPSATSNTTKTPNTSDYCVAGNTYESNMYFNNDVCSLSNCHFNTSLIFNSQQSNNFQSNSGIATTLSNSLCSSNTYQSSQQASSINSGNIYAPTSRQSYSSTQGQPPRSMMFLQQNRPSSALYSVTHFITQPYFFLHAPPAASVSTSSPVTMSPRPNQRWIPSTQYLRAPSALQSYHIAQQTSTSTLSSQQWPTQNQPSYRVNSSHHIPSSSHQFNDYLSEQKARPQPTSKSRDSVTHGNCLQHKGKSRSSEGSSSADERLDNVQVLSGTYSNTSMSYSRRPSVASSDTFSLSTLHKSRIVKPAASTSDLEFRKVKLYTNYKDDNISNKEISSPGTRLTDKDAKTTSPHESEELHNVLPIASSVSEELERQALEQYQPSDENVYQELERQAEEQYNQDHSENCLGPPNENLLFGGRIDDFFVKMANHCWVYSLQLM